MKVILRTFIINSAAIWILNKLLESFIVPDLQSLLAAAVVLTLANLIIRPVVKLITLPINILTLGLFSGISNLATLYLTVKLIPGLSLTPTSFPGLVLGNFAIPKTTIPKPGTLIIATIILSLIYNLIHDTINWLFNKQ